MAYAVEALLDQGQLGIDLWRSLLRQRVTVNAHTRDNCVMLPDASAIQKLEDWRVELLSEETKQNLR